MDFGNVGLQAIKHERSFDKSHDTRRRVRRIRSERKRGMSEKERRRVVVAGGRGEERVRRETRDFRGKEIIRHLGLRGFFFFA